ncbi:uncharacterized protein [Amphiura filiformis]|uniref:uncharacterized protein isoform X2 n=1 Tax=Amphiura filiformis TaxID=82378 RepID=UPI003B2246EA
MMMIVQAKQYYNLPVKSLSNIIPARDGKKPVQNGDSDKPSTSISSSDDVFVKNTDSNSHRSKESKDRYSREPHRRSYDPNRNTYDPNRRNKERTHQRPMYDSRQSARERERDPSPQGRRSRQDGYNGSYERNGRYGDNYGYSRDYVPGKPPSSPRRSRSHQSPNRSYSPSRAYNTGRSTSPPRNHSPTRSHSPPPRVQSPPPRVRSPSPDRVHNHAFVSEGSREVTINSDAKREEVEFHFDENGQRVTTGHTVIAVTAYRANQSSPDGPPKPPRRQQSLNRIHIPEGPDYDPTSASDSPQSGPNSPHISRHHVEPNYANYTSGYSKSGMTYTTHTQSHNVTTARVPQLSRQRSFPEPRNGYHDDPPTYRDVEDYRARSAVSEWSNNKPKQVRGRRNVDSSNRSYRSDGELNAAYSEPELDWERRPRRQLQHSDSLRTDPGRYDTGERPKRASHLKHTDSLRSAPGGYSYGNSWQEEPSWKRDPRLRYQQEQHAFHGSLNRPSRRDHVPRSQRPTSLPFPDKYGGNEGSYNPQHAKYDDRSRSPDYDNYPTTQTQYSQQTSESNGWRHARRSTSVTKQGYSSDSGVSSFRNPSESDPVYENTERKQHDLQYANSNGYHNKKNGIWERDGGGYVIDGPHEMPVDVPVEMQQQQQLESAPLMTNQHETKEGSIAGNHTVPKDEIQDAQSASTQDSKWAEHLARREQRREHLRSSSQDSIESNKSDQDLIEEKQRPQRRHTTEINLTSESIIQPKQADTQESGYPSEMPKRQRQGGRAPSQGEYVSNPGYHVPYSESNAPYAPKRPFDPYNPYHYGPYGEVPPGMNYPPVHGAGPYKGYPPYGSPMSPVDPRYGAQSPNPYGSDHSYDNQQVPGRQSPTMPRKADGWGNRPPYSEGGPPPPRWPGPDPRYGPMGYPQDPYMPTYSSTYGIPPYLQQGGYYQPPIPSAMFYGGYPGEAAHPQGIPPGMASPQRARSVDALELQANVQPQLNASPVHSPSASLSPQRSLSPDEKTKRIHELRQRVKSYIPTDEKFKRSKSVDSAEPAREEMIAPTQSYVAYAANVPNQSSAPAESNRQEFTDGSKLPGNSQFQEPKDTATSVGAKLFLQKKKEAVMQDIKKTMINDRMYGSEPELTNEREVPFKSSSARPLRVSSGSGNDTGDSREKRRKSEKATEDALDELEEMYALLDKETEDLLESGEYHPQYDRLTELKFRAKQRLEELRLEREMEENGLIPPSQRGKRRPRRERAKSDITGDNYRSQSLTNLTQSDDERQQQFFPYRTSQHPDNLNLDDQSYKPPKNPQKMQFIQRKTEYSSDEEGSEVRQPQSTLYRHPRSEDYLGYSSDSSPSPERRMKNSKRKPVAQPRKGVKDGEDQVLPEYIKKSTADTQHSAPKSGYDSDKSGRSSLADRSENSSCLVLP